MINNNQSRFEVLDGIRGIAIIMVLLFHYINNPLQVSDIHGIIPKALMYLTYFGWVGVDLFFVLSGFLIGGILLKNRKSSNYFKTFYTRRVLRIIPVYFLLLVIFYVLTHFIVDPNLNISKKPLPAWSYFTFTQNILMGLRGHFGSAGLTPTWSLAIEEQFYLLCPLLIWLVKPRLLPWILTLFIGIAIISRYYSTNWYQSYVWFLSRLDSLSIGVFLAYLFFFERAVLQKISLSILCSITALLFMIIITSELWLGSLGILKHTVFALFFSVLITIPLLYPNSIWASLLRNKLLINIGLLSYSLYLFHMFINNIFHQVLLHHNCPVLNTKNDIAVSIAALMVSLLFSWILYTLLEKPAMKYGKSFPY